MLLIIYPALHYIPLKIYIMISSSSGNFVQQYIQHVRLKQALFYVLGIVLILTAIFAVTVGEYHISFIDVFRSLIGDGSDRFRVVIWNIRMPRILAAIGAGWGLALSGTAIQALLKNPLGSPFTLGISQGAAFGASCAIVVFGVGGMENDAGLIGVESFINNYIVYSLPIFAFLGALVATAVILLLATVKQMAAESVILAGVALSALFTSGTILVQYFASEVELASVIFWTFGDVARSDWTEITIMLGAVGLAMLYLFFERWNLNVLGSGDETAKGLGVNVKRLRFQGMLVASLIAALITAFHGVIAFLGLLAPHLAKLLVGDDYRLVIPLSGVIGALLLLLADTAGRLLIGSGTLPVGVLTSFMGAPLFLYLLIRGRQR